MKKIFVVIVLFLACVGWGAMPFELPKGTKVISTDESGRTWQMNAWMPGDFEAVCKKLKAALEKAGYKMKHEIKMPKKPDMTLYSWEKGQDNLLLMVFEMEPGKIAFCYGICNDL